MIGWNFEMGTQGFVEYRAGCPMPNVVISACPRRGPLISLSNSRDSMAPFPASCGLLDRLAVAAVSRAIASPSLSPTFRYSIAARVAARPPSAYLPMSRKAPALVCKSAASHSLSPTCHVSRTASVHTRTASRHSPYHILASAKTCIARIWPFTSLFALNKPTAFFAAALASSSSSMRSLTSAVRRDSMAGSWAEASFNTASPRPFSVRSRAFLSKSERSSVPGIYSTSSAKLELTLAASWELGRGTTGEAFLRGCTA
mmetsp:Transcript_140113/g.254791  ORF Transcript_140113/g.254791 Transcript_140113/m.254791 type:complete len:258 (+) Transcript_140113:288-1061(+)